MGPGTSSIVTRALIEEFAPRFLGQPGVIWISESGKKVLAFYDQLARSIGLNIQADRNLPDTILVDLAPKHPLLIYAEVVTTGGPISQERKAALTKLSNDAGFSSQHLAFVTAYLDRSDQVFKRTVENLAWGTFVWFASEPSNLICLHEGNADKVRALTDWL
jgi:hypothetical protein